MPEFDHALFSFKSYSALFPLFLAHGLILEVELFMFIDQYLSLSSSPSFTLLFICSLSLFLHGLRILVVAFGHIWGAYSVFEEMSRDEDLFNSLVFSFGSNGFYDEVLVLFE